MLGPLLDQVTCPIGTLLADGASDGEPVYRSVAVHSPEAEVIIPPRATAVPSDTTERRFGFDSFLPRGHPIPSDLELRTPYRRRP